MAEVKWIKITTDIFDDEKIKIIDTMPARDEILVIWFKLLSLAGRSNQGGMLVMNNRIPYTNEMLAAVFNRNLNMVQLSLKIFETYGMIEVEDNEAILISNWDKHQNIEGLDKIREQNKARQQTSRNKKKQLQINESNVTDNVTVTVNNATDIELDKELELDIDKSNKKPKLTKIEIIINTYTNDSALLLAIEEFIKMRKTIKKPMTDRAVELMLKKLNTLAEFDCDKINILNQSIMNCYQGIFQIKQEAGSGGKYRANNAESKKPNNTESEGDRLARRAIEKFGNTVEDFECEF
ncbi:phage replisome organizer N-terminal domain-containing protein [Clostridium estertheticum]|uniref:phage replisome organizer N-terminal domain-containing protein n=1 Tax=Clostridium estertheticum TaxID=238834 RepID=UPI0013EE7D44|nr:phage replisome organizer N-terminal domain-containing protein [Clostridium estertheticum]MBZ9608663.1 phage replisome organizer N-terminal domain-containing protein [Clostridium estertheticum]